MTLLIQLFAQYVVAAVFLATDILFPSFANVGVGQFRVLGGNNDCCNLPIISMNYFRLQLQERFLYCFIEAGHVS